MISSLHMRAVAACEVQARHGLMACGKLRGMSASANAPPPLLVACLCAAWCHTCGAYLPVLAALAAQRPGLRFAWIDIEDDEEALCGVDVVDFPTLLIAHGEAIAFYGPVLPHMQTARQLLQRALQGALSTVTGTALAGLPTRLRALR